MKTNGKLLLSLALLAVALTPFAFSGTFSPDSLPFYSNILKFLAEEPYTAEDFAQEDLDQNENGGLENEVIKQQQFNAFACIMYTKVRFQQQNEEVNNIIKTVQAHDTQAVYKKMFAQHMAYCMMVIQHSEAEDVMKPFFRGINVSQLFLRVLYDFLSGFKRSDH